MKTISASEAQEMQGMKNWRYAWTKIPLAGKFMRIRKGTKVRAKFLSGSSYIVERDKWRGSMVPLCNVLAGVPRSALIFAKPAKPKCQSTLPQTPAVSGVPKRQSAKSNARRARS